MSAVKARGRPKKVGRLACNVNVSAPAELADAMRSWPRGLASRLAQAAWARELAQCGMSERERLTAELELLGVRLGECLRREQESN